MRFAFLNEKFKKMKIRIPTVLIVFCLVACHKDGKLAPGTAPTATLASASIKYDTIPDKAVLKLKLFKDSLTHDETAISFEHTAGLAYNLNLDAVYFAGFGQLSLASISSDGKDLAHYELPYTRGMATPDLICTQKTDGICKDDDER